MAQAEAKVVQAQYAFNSAESSLIALVGPYVHYYETQLAEARSALEAIQADPLVSDSAREEAENIVVGAQNDLDAALLYSDGEASEDTIVLARADLEAARASLVDAEVAWQIIQAGPDALTSPVIMTGPQTTRLELARRAVKDSCLTAPFDGTVTSLSAVIGQTVGTGPIIRIASTQDLLVRIYLDETDVDKAAAGNRVQLTLDAYPDLLLNGGIVMVEPVLAFVDGTPVVVAWVELPDAPEVAILAGMTVEVEVIAHEALGALLVPIQALHELEPGSYAVFAVEEDGNLLLTPVSTGLRDYANVQILSGLQAGDLVSTGTVETR
jgi:multidrug efflux pump subunit AcrA (membrane-fusion protein)